MRRFDGPYEFNAFLSNHSEFYKDDPIFKDIRTLCQLLAIKSCSCDRKRYTAQLNELYREVHLHLRLAQRDRLKQILQTDRIQLLLNHELIIDF